MATQWKQCFPLYFIVLDSQVKILQVKAIEFHRIQTPELSYIILSIIPRSPRNMSSFPWPFVLSWAIYIYIKSYRSWHDHWLSLEHHVTWSSVYVHLMVNLIMTVTWSSVYVHLMVNLIMTVTWSSVYVHLMVNLIIWQWLDQVRMSILWSIWSWQ